MPESHRIPIEAAARSGSTPEVAAVHHEADSDDWLVFCHGLRSDKSGSYEGRCQRAVREGYNAVRFDCRGCGESDGAFVDATLEARLADLRAVIEYFDPGSYVLFGSSFGGKMTFHAAATDDRVRAVATRAPVTSIDTFDDYRDPIDRDGAIQFETGERIDHRFLEALDRHPFDDVIESLAVPVAIFHGGADEVVDPGDSFAAARRLETELLLERFAGEGHRFSRVAEDRLRQRLFDWLEWVDGERRR